jgi:hypothetical protein
MSWKVPSSCQAASSCLHDVRYLSRHDYNHVYLSTSSTVFSVVPDMNMYLYEEHCIIKMGGGARGIVVG